MESLSDQFQIKQYKNKNRNNNKDNFDKKEKLGNVYGYYAVKYISEGIAHYKIRNPLSVLNDFLQETTDLTKYDIKIEDNKDDIIVFIEGDIKYLNTIMNQHIVLEELNIDTSEWSSHAIKQLCRFTINTDKNGLLYSSINHQRSMTDIKINITFDDKQNNMCLSVQAPAWKCNSKTQELVNTVIDVIHDTILYDNTPLHQEIIKCFNDFNNKIKNLHPRNDNKNDNKYNSPQEVYKKNTYKTDNYKADTLHVKDFSNRFENLQVSET